MTALILRWNTDCPGGGWLTQRGFSSSWRRSSPSPVLHFWGCFVPPLSLNPPIASHCPASPTCSHLRRELAAHKPFLSLLVHFCLLPTTALDKVVCNKPHLSACPSLRGISVNIPSHQWGLALATVFSPEKKKSYMCERGKERKKRMG